MSACLERARQAGVSWPLPEELDDDRLEQLLYPDTPPAGHPSRPLPDMVWLHRELRRRHVTLQLLWEEYRSDHPDGYSYTQFTQHYRRWQQTIDPTLRQRYVAGEKMFVDWAGATLSWVDRATGEAHPAWLFVAVLGASNYTYAEVFANQQLPHWIEGHVNAFEFFGGVQFRNGVDTSDLRWRGFFSGSPEESRWSEAASSVALMRSLVVVEVKEPLQGHVQLLRGGENTCGGMRRANAGEGPCSAGARRSRSSRGGAAWCACVWSRDRDTPHRNCP